MAGKPIYEHALQIRKEAVGERHPDYAQSLSNLAVLLWAQRDYAGAAALDKQALLIDRANLELAAVVQSERQQLAMNRKLSGELNAYLSLAPLAGIAPGSVYEHVLHAKGSVLERQRRRRDLRQLVTNYGHETEQRFAEYQQIVTRLARLAFSVPNPKQLETWRASLDELSRKRDRIEAELTARDARFRDDRAETSATPEQLDEPHCRYLSPWLTWCATSTDLTVP